MYELYVKPLRVDLDEETTKKFEAFKKAKGLKQNTEAIRLLIHEAYNTLSPVDASEHLEQKVPAS